MQRSTPIFSTKAAVLGGFLLLGALIVVAWLLVTASPASAQADDTTAVPEPAATDATTSPEPALPAPSDSPAPPLLDLEIPAPDLPPLPLDLNTVTQTVLPPLTDVLPPALDPVVEDVSELLPPPVRGRVETVLSGTASSPSRSDPAPSPSAAASESAPPGPTAGAGPTAVRAIGRGAAHSRYAGELRAADSLSPEGDTPAPPGPRPAVPAQGTSASGFSVGRDFGQSLLLLGVVAAGVMFILGRGRRLLIEALGWLPAPWCLLIERPG